MHPQQYCSHYKGKHIFKFNSVPIIILARDVQVYLPHHAERINYCSQIDPGYQDGEESNHQADGVGELGFHIASSQGGKDVAGIMDDEYDDSSCDLIG